MQRRASAHRGTQLACIHCAHTCPTGPVFETTSNNSTHKFWTASCGHSATRPWHKPLCLAARLCSITCAAARLLTCTMTGLLGLCWPARRQLRSSCTQVLLSTCQQAPRSLVAMRNCPPWHKCGFARHAHCALACVLHSAAHFGASTAFCHTVGRRSAAASVVRIDAASVYPSVQPADCLAIQVITSSPSMCIAQRPQLVDTGAKAIPAAMRCSRSQAACWHIEAAGCGATRPADKRCHPSSMTKCKTLHTLRACTEAVPFASHAPVRRLAAASLAQDCDAWRAQVLALGVLRAVCRVAAARCPVCAASCTAPCQHFQSAVRRLSPHVRVHLSQLTWCAMVAALCPPGYYLGAAAAAATSHMACKRRRNARRRCAALCAQCRALPCAGRAARTRCVHTAARGHGSIGSKAACRRPEESA